MPSRARDWFEQGQRDLEHARHAAEGGYHEWACFSAQQASEKALKAVYQSLNGEAWGHSVLGLLENLLSEDEPAEELRNCARLLDRFYIPTCYPNGFDRGIPADYYTDADSQQAIRCAEAILRYCEGRLSGPPPSD